MSLFKGSGYITITLETNISLAAATVTRIHYKKPTGTTGYWSASVSGTTLTYNVANADIDVAGLWEFQSYVEFSGEKSYGDIVYKEFQLPLI